MTAYNAHADGHSRAALLIRYAAFKIGKIYKINGTKS